MPGNARAEAIEAMCSRYAEIQPCVCHSAYTGRGLVDPHCAYHDTVDELTGLLDAIPTEVGTRLFAVERGGLEQVGWVQTHDAGPDGPLYAINADPEDHADDLADPTLKPVYRLTEGAST